MSKIETYKERKRIAEKIAEDVRHALGLNKDGTKDMRNDKAVVSCDFVRLDNGNFDDMVFTVRASYGYYGCSSGYSSTSKELGAYLAKAITENLPAMLNSAARRAADASERARIDAIEEAKLVISETC